MPALTTGGDATGLAWRRASFFDAGAYTVSLSEADRGRIRASVCALGDTQLAAPESLHAEELAFDGDLAARFAAALEEVRLRRGFVVLRGLPLEVSRDQFIAAVWGIGLCFGGPLSQSAEGELIGHVLDASREDSTPRMFRSNLELRLHTDWTAMLSLACWHRSRSGGSSVITSSITVHDAIATEAPHLLEPLYRGFHYHRLGEEAPGEDAATPYRIPVFAFRDGQMSCRYQRAGIAAGQRALGIPLSNLELEAMNRFDEVARAPENRLAFDLERGDMVIVNNYTVMHARTAFEEFPEPEKRRHLVRLWLDAEGFRALPEHFMLFGANGVPPQPGRRCTYDFKKLYGDDPAASGGVPRLDLEAGETARR